MITSMARRLLYFYKFKAELKALKETYGDDITEDLDEFNTTDKCIALQIVSGRGYIFEGG